jgi:hypothetical protein
MPLTPYRSLCVQAISWVDVSAAGELIVGTNFAVLNLIRVLLVGRKRRAARGLQSAAATRLCARGMRLPACRAIAHACARMSAGLEPARTLCSACRTLYYACTTM